MYLVDTNVISAGAPYRATAFPELADWMDRHSDRLYLSVATIAEIEDGIAKSRRQGATSKAGLLREWSELIQHLYGDRILPFDIAAARLAGQLSDRARGAGQPPGFVDLMIAATAQAHGFSVLTRNLKHFTPLGVAAYDPFDELPITPDR